MSIEHHEVIGVHENSCVAVNHDLWLSPSCKYAVRNFLDDEQVVGCRGRLGASPHRTEEALFKDRSTGKDPAKGSRKEIASAVRVSMSAGAVLIGLSVLVHESLRCRAACIPAPASIFGFCDERHCRRVKSARALLET